ncbi:hypothetical protein JKP88DRAFT_248301 [Tribonema minus]|uniref:Uncharacterized protein n=1 Tax=Tribonema minus TaxID=303371 RepID=A0A835YX42_9STRA|nr:hypothetical protein JKP88DRAFT_248301 [Tribonema minus]
MSYALEVLIVELAAHCKSVENGAWRLDCALLVAERYRVGLHPLFKPNSEPAQSLLTEIARVSTGVIRYQAEHSMRSMVGEEDVDVNAAEVPMQWGERVLTILQRMASVERIPQGRLDGLVLRQDAPQHTDARIGRHDAPRPADGLRHDVPYMPTALVGHDVQNVHDAYVKTATTRLIEYALVKAEELEAAHNQSSWFRLRQCLPNDAIAKFKKELTMRPDMEPHRQNAKRVIDSLVCYAMGTPACSEVRLLEAVLSVVEIMANSDNLKVTLAAQLASAVEYGIVVCSSGKKSRMVSVLETTEGPSIISLHVLRQEVLHMASRVREQVLSEHDEAAREAYNKGAMELVGKMQERYVRKLHEQYAAIIDNKLLAVFDQEAENYI